MTEYLVAGAGLLIGALAAAVGALWHRAKVAELRGRVRELELMNASLAQERDTARARTEEGDRFAEDQHQRYELALSAARGDLKAERERYVAFLALLEKRLGGDPRFADARREFARLVGDGLRPPGAAGAPDPRPFPENRDGLLPFPGPSGRGGSGGDTPR